MSSLRQQLAKKLQKMELEEQKRKRREAEMRRQQATMPEAPDGAQDDDLVSLAQYTRLGLAGLLS